MECSDEKIISLIRQTGRKPEYQAVMCLKKCESKTAGVLLKMNLQDKDDRASIYYQSMAEFIILVRKGRFLLTGEAKICTYLTEIARRKWLNFSKKNKKYQSPPAEFVQPNTTETDETGNDTSERIRKALNQLADQDRDILTAFYFYGMDLDEYAKKNNLNYTAVKKRISRARARLKNILNPTQE